MRNEFPAKVKVAAFDRSGGRCEKCTAHLYTGKYHFDHVIPASFDGPATLENCMVLCVNCHGEKTTGRDVPTIAKVKRIRTGHLGAKPKRPWPKRSFR